MERGEQEPPIAHEHGLAVERAHHLDTRSEAPDARSPDEHTAKRKVVTDQSDVRLEALHLPPERIPIDDEVDDVEVLAVQHDHPRAGAEDGAVEPADRVVETVQLREAHDGRGLATGDDQAVETLELLGQTNLDHLGTEQSKRGRMLAERALQREDADAQRPAHALGYQPRTSSRSPSASELEEIPTIGSPRPAETWASTLGSSKCVVASTIAFARVSGSPDLKMPEPTNTPSAPSCMQSDASAGVAMPPAVNVTTGRRPFSATQRMSSYGARCSLAAA